MPKESFSRFAAFTAVFAVGVAVVFWGCWSTAVTFISPDDGIRFTCGLGDTWRIWWNGFLTTGKVLPSDLFWSGLFISPHFCRELKYALAIYCAALGLVYFLRGRGLSPLASYGAALLLAFCGYWFTLFSAGHGGWFIWMTYGVFAFGLIDRAVESGKLTHFLLLGVVVAWAGFNQPDLWLLFTALTAIYFIFRCAIARKIPWKGTLLSTLVFGLVGLPNFLGLTNVVKERENQIAKGENITSAPKGTDGQKSTLDDRAARWEFVTNWSLPSNETVEFVNARVNGDTSCPFVLSINRAKGVRPYTGALGRPLNAPSGNYRQHSLYVGGVTCLFALLGVVLGFRRKTVLFFAGAALVTYAFSLGRYFEPAYRCIFALPMGDLIRCPVKWHHLTELSLCVLAGYGIEGVLKAFDRPAFASSRKIAVGALGLLVLFGLFGLVRNARLYCAPVDYSRAIQAKCSAQLSVLPREQFQNPQVAEMVRRGQIISVANWLGNPNAYLVQVLQPVKPAKPVSPKPLPFAAGVLSVLTVLGVAFLSVRPPAFLQTKSFA